jgi:queuine tRNA-ribosyltransferase
VQFRSHIDGSLHDLTPEDIIDIQRVIGSDIMMVLDECTGYPCEKGDSEKSNVVSMKWAERCWERYRTTSDLFGHRQNLFGIVQGGVYEDLRAESASFLSGIDFQGYAIGGLAVGEPVDMMYSIVESCTTILPSTKPRYLMGVGKPENLLEAIGRGIDMFDCVLPTRNGRNACFFTRNGEVTITNAKHKEEFSPVDEQCRCYTCRNFTRSYLRHLFISKEILGLELATIHNLYYYQWLMRGAREAIRQNRYNVWKMEQLAACRQETEQYS